VKEKLIKFLKTDNRVLDMMFCEIAKSENLDCHEKEFARANSSINDMRFQKIAASKGQANLNHLPCRKLFGLIEYRDVPTIMGIAEKFYNLLNS